MQTELAFTLAKNATKPNHFEIIPLQTTRKENNWKTKEALARAAVTLETERIKESNPWCLWWWWWWWWFHTERGMLQWYSRYYWRQTSHVQTLPLGKSARWVTQVPYGGVAGSEQRYMSMPDKLRASWNSKLACVWMCVCVVCRMLW